VPPSLQGDLGYDEYDEAPVFETLSSEEASSQTSIASVHESALSSSDNHESLSSDKQDSFVASQEALSTQNEQEEQAPKKKASKVRLTLTEDGKAELIEAGSSPIRVQPLPLLDVQVKAGRRGLFRSNTTIGLSQVSGQTSVAPGPLHRTPTGRSRDARTWEFYCDSDTRNALSEQAEQDRSGSALGAIGLLRARSNSVLKSNMNKRSAQHSNSSSSKRTKHNGDRPKLSRASSSLARLQTQSTGDLKKVSKEKKGGDQIMMAKSPSGDSDKENWLPGTRFANPRRRNLPVSQQEKQGQRVILKENVTVPSQSETFNTPIGTEHGGKRKPGKGGVEIFDENRDNEGNDATAVMHGEDETVDLDCVQGLLSLSQGNWR
jgi:hypothetical protein